MSVFLMLEAQEQAAAWKRRALAAEAMNRSQSERVSRLEEALKPFAEAFDEINAGKGVWVERPVNESGYLNIEHFRAARSALNQGADDGR